MRLATTRSTVVGVIHKLDRRRVRWSHLYTDDLLWRNFLSPQCRNYSREPDNANLGPVNHQYFTWPTRIQNSKSLALAVREILRPTGCKIVKRVMWPTEPNHARLGKIFHRLRLTYTPNLISLDALVTKLWRCKMGWFGWGTQRHHSIEWIRRSYSTLTETAAILYRFRNIASYMSKVAVFNLSHAFGAPAGGDPGGISLRSLKSENYRVHVALFAWSHV